MQPQFLVIDLFCGAGGTTCGFEMARGVAKVIACVNHDAKAIESHWRNHPEVLHFEEDIRTLELSALVKCAQMYQRWYPEAKLILWASLECTNFSKAKGGQPRDADSRTLADHLHRYVQALRPDYIQIENVVEFMAWGPLDKNGKPVSRRNGSDFLRWCREMDTHGYRHEWRELNAADYGAYTSRNRLFGCFARPGLPIVWPQATHSKKVKPGMFGELQRWKAVKEVLDFTDHGQSIFGRKVPLVDKTLERVYEGLVKYVAGGRDAFLVKYNSMNQQGRYLPPDVDEPCPVIATQNRLGIAFISKAYSGAPAGKVSSVENPAGTVTTVDHHQLVSANFLIQYNGGSASSMAFGIDRPMRTITTNHGAKHNLVQPCFIQTYYGTGANVSAADTASPTITTKDRLAVVNLSWLDKQYGSGVDNHQSIEQPAGTVMANDKHCLTQAFILNPSWEGANTSVEHPAPVVIARQDKAPLYLVEPVAAADCIHWQPKPGDSEVMLRIREFMRLYGIADIRMRMLKVAELLKIQGFPDDYVLMGTQTDQKKFIGNSVVPHVVCAWVQALAKAIPAAKPLAA